MTSRYFVGSALYGGASTNPFIEAEVVQVPAPSSVVFRQTNSNLGLELAKKADVSALNERVTAEQLASALVSKVDTSALTTELSAVNGRIDDRVTTSTFLAQFSGYATTASVDAKLDAKADDAALEGKADRSELLAATTSLQNLLTEALADATGDKTDEAYVDNAVLGLSTQVAATYAPLASPTFSGVVTLPTAASVNVGTKTLAVYVSELLTGAQGGLAPISGPIFLDSVTLPSLANVFHPDPDEGQLSLQTSLDRLQTSINNLAIALGVTSGVGGLFSFAGDVVLFTIVTGLQGQIAGALAAQLAQGTAIAEIKDELDAVPATYAPSDSPVFANQVTLPEPGAVYVGDGPGGEPLTLLDLVRSQALTDLTPVTSQIAALEAALLEKADAGVLTSNVTSLTEMIHAKADLASPVFSGSVELPGPEFVYVGRVAGIPVTLNQLLNYPDANIAALADRVTSAETAIASKASSTDLAVGLATALAARGVIQQLTSSLNTTVTEDLTPRLVAVETGLTSKADKSSVDSQLANIAAGIASTINLNQDLLDAKASTVYVDGVVTSLTGLINGTLSSQVTGLFTAVQSKADQASVTSQFAAKADTSDVNAALTAVNNTLDTKASKQVVDLLVAQSDGSAPLPVRIALPLDPYSEDGSTVQLIPNPPLANQPYQAIIQPITEGSDRVGHLMLRGRTSEFVSFGYKEHLWTPSNPVATYQPCNLKTQPRLFEVVLLQNGRVFDACTLQTGSQTLLIR